MVVFYILITIAYGIITAFYIKLIILRDKQIKLLREILNAKEQCIDITQKQNEILWEQKKLLEEILLDGTHSN